MNFFTHLQNQLYGERGDTVGDCERNGKGKIANPFKHHFVKAPDGKIGTGKKKFVSEVCGVNWKRKK